METKTPAELAEKVAVEMLKKDKVSQHLEIRLERIDAGSAIVSMLVRDDMMNGFGICHGGIIFSLADTAFACACNSRNRKTVALACTINFIVPVVYGDMLVAYAKEVSLSGRTGVYDITVKNETGAIVAEFRGTSYGTSSNTLD
jgi:acyl-CoA thioesterase